MTLLEDARRLARDGFTPWEDSCHLKCELCGEDFAEDEAQHAPDCPWRSMPKIVKALELIDRLGFTFEEHDGGLNVISRPRQRRLISERSARVLESAEALAEFYGKFTFIGGFPGAGELCRLIQVLVAALKGAGDQEDKP